MAKPPSLRSIDVATLPGLPEGDKLLESLNPFMGQVGAAFAQGLTFRENFACEVKDVQVEAPDDWTPVAFEGAWDNLGAPWETCAWRKDEAGVVRLRGVAAGGAAPSAVLTLPAHCAPAAAVSLPANGNNAFASLEVTAAGTVNLVAGAPGVSLRGHFEAADRTPPAWPSPLKLALDARFPGKPTGLLVLNAREKSGAGVGGVSADWEPAVVDGRQGVKVRRFSGLAPGRKYTLSLLVLAG